jgi:hypothetical protein
VNENGRSEDRSKAIAQRVARKLLLPPDQRRKERREELERRIRDQPEKMSKEAFQRGALRFFLQCFRRIEPHFLPELREILSEPLSPGLQSVALRSLSDRYHLPPTAAVVIECIKTHLMWLALPSLPNVWHFELPEGALTDPFRSAKIAGRPYPFVFVAEGWNPNTETLDSAKKRLRRQFKAAVTAKADKATFWKSAEIDHLELRLFEESPSLEKLRRNLECLAEKQTSPKLTIQQLAKRFSLTKEAVRVGLSEAADLIGLPKIRSAPAGAPKGQRRRT